MNIAITFRHMDVSEPMKDYAREKVAKLQKFLRQPMRARVTLSLQNKLQCCEVEINAGPSHFLAHENNGDMYAALDRVVDKLERQISAAHGSSVSQKKGAESAGVFAAAQESIGGSER